MIDKTEIFDTGKKFLVHNMVTIVFVFLGVVGFQYSGLTLPFFVNELLTRITRNSFLVLALIIPVLAGMGLNFAIVLGAMAGQVAIIAVTHWGVVGVQGFILAMALAFPVALIFGFLTGSLLNKTKGKEMITSLILGFFANGLYQLVFLLFIGTIIPMDNPVLVLSSGVGLRVTIDLSEGIKYAIDHIWRLSFPVTTLLSSIALMIYFAVRYLQAKKKKTEFQVKKSIYFTSAALLLAVWSIFIINTNSMFNMLKVPMATVLAIVLVCIFTVFLMRTKLGQDLKTVGQDRHIATVAGINSNRVRLIAILISTVLASWGQLFFLQNLGTMSTYGSHEQVGMFSVAALLIGGASVSKATIGQALVGVILFHTLFIVSPLAGRNAFGDAQLGEFFRAFVAYGVIGLSLGMHAWKKMIQSRNELKAQ